MKCFMCHEDAYARQLCRRHYDKWLKYGDPNGGKGTPSPPRPFPGLGVLRCGFCDDPLLDHAIGPCPTSGVEILR